jgi:methyl-accepting chemotaxis protein/cytochrome b561
MTYSRRLQIIHWSVALLVTCQLAIAVVLTQLRSLEYGQLVLELHRQLGLVILMLILFRVTVGWRDAPARDKSSTLPGWQHGAAALVHRLFFFLLVAQPIVGIFLAWGRGDTVGFFGLLHVSPPLEISDAARERLMTLHTGVAILLFSLCVVHVGAVIFNRIVRSVSVIDRMLPAVPADRLTNRVPIGAQLALAFGVVVAIAISMGINAVATYRTFNQAITEYQQGEVAAADQTRAAQVAWKERLGLSLAGHEEGEAARIKELAEQTVSSLQDAMSHTPPGDVRPLFESTLSSLSALAAAPSLDAVKAIDEALQGIVDAQVLSGLQRRTDNEQAAARGHDLIVLTVLPMALAGLIAALILARSVTGSLARMRNLIGSIESERSDSPITVAGAGEFAALTRDIVRMRAAVEERSRVASERRAQLESERARLAEEQQVRESANERQRSEERRANRERLAAEFEREVAAIVETVARTAQSLTETAGSMASSASTSAGRSRDASAIAHETKDTASQVASGTAELSSTARAVRENAQASRARALRAVEEATAAKTQLDALVAAARQIGSITDVISGVARQTNLLAINARVEAARAGDVGRGFSVVANEVKDLAGQTANATIGIGKQIDEVTAAAMRSSQSLERLCEVIEEMKRSAAEISEATDTQYDSTRNIAERISRISQSAGSVASTIRDAETTADATEQLSGEVARAAQVMGEKADQLSEQVVNFVLELRSSGARREQVEPQAIQLRA